jgi:site-specific DNA recombinase
MCSERGVTGNEYPRSADLLEAGSLASRLDCAGPIAGPTGNHLDLKMFRLSSDGVFAASVSIAAFTIMRINVLAGTPVASAISLSRSTYLFGNLTCNTCVSIVSHCILQVHMKAIAYTRVSTEKQSDQGISLEAQSAKIRHQAAADDIEITELIEDSASGKDTDRPGLQRILQMVEKRQITHVYVAKLDRLTRSVGDLAQLLEVFSKRGVLLVSVSDKLDTGTASGKLVLNIMMSVSQWEREAIGERTRDAMAALKSNRFPAGKIPYGWQAQPRTEDEIKQGIRRSMVKCEAEQAIIKLAAEGRKGGASFQSIADDLNIAALRTRSGAAWAHQYVRNILKDGK